MVLKSAKLVKQLIAICCAGVMAASAAACGANTDTRTQITVWSWEPSMKQVIAGFEKDNPDIHVVWKNTSGYDKLNNAIQDGYGIPDVVQLEYYALRQYAVSSQLVPIAGRTEGYADFYTPGTWASVQLNGRVYGLPMDSGPMAFFYNNSVFEQVGVDASKIRTWDDYYEAAKKLKKIGVYITADSGDASFYDTMIWLAGGRPFSTSNDGKNVTIRLTEDKGTREFTEFWQKMIDEGLVATNLTSWSDRWKSAVGQGEVASLFSGAWLPSLLMSDIPGAAGLWRVAQMPTPDGKATTSENGGSALAVLQRSRKPEASYRFIEYACHNAKGITTRVDGGAFPADKNTLSDSKFLSKTTVTDDRGIEVPYFGGQEYNRVLSQAAENVSTGYQYLPFEVYARSDFRSTVGKAYKWSSLLRKEQNRLNVIAAGGQVSDTSNIGDALKNTESSDRIQLKGGIALWQKDLKEYGANQGFTIQ